MPTNATTEALQQAIVGMTYQSETDEPWEVIFWPAVVVAPTADVVLKRGHHKAAARVAEQTVEGFFAPLGTQQDWYGEEENAVAAKYRLLLDVVKKQLQNPKVFMVGERKLTVYVVGQAKESGWAGLKTTSVET